MIVIPKPTFVGRFRSLLVIVVAALVGGLALVTFSARAATCPCSIWSTTDVPQIANDFDGKAIEVGVKFKSDTAGQVTGIKFYKGTKNTGTHTGSLWTVSGTRLAQATFTNELASGWQTVSFATPVTITANTTYVASYFSPRGYYASTANYFTAQRDNAPLHALSSSASGGNGIYRYTATSAFPNTSYQASNYWVDVVLAANTIDTTPPTVSSVSPAANATSVPAGTTVSAVFSEDLNAATVNSTSFQLKAIDGSVVPAAVSYTAANRTATLTPTGSLNANSQYTATLVGGAAGIKDAANNPLVNNYSWSFTTATGVIPPNGLEQGFGGPVLIITSSAKPFSKYYSEILRAEGINSFTGLDLSQVTAAEISKYDSVILGEMPLNDAQVTMLNDWVTTGGNLIAMRPDKKLAGLLGLTDQATARGDAYLLVDTANSPGKGITGQTMQYHGGADNYGLSTGTVAVANIYSDASTATSNPAVTLRSVGSVGGQAAAFTYDLARSVELTHQGNPVWAGDERDGSAPIRPNDLFFGAKAGDVQPDYVDLNKVAIPQADEQQRLLTNLLGYMGQDKKPVPKTWYFPKGKKAVVVMVSDDHGTASGTKDSFERFKAAAPAGCAVATWDCIRATSLVYTSVPLTDAEAAAYRSQGFDLGVHVNTGCANWTPQSLRDTFTADLQSFAAKYPSQPAQVVSRTHCIAYSDYATTPKVELENGIRIDLNYYYWPGSWVQNRPGFMTGSGIPMRFGDTDGSMVDVYQVPSHLVNESGMTFPAAINTLLDRAIGSEGYYGAWDPLESTCRHASLSIL